MKRVKEGWENTLANLAGDEEAAEDFWENVRINVEDGPSHMEGFWDDDKLKARLIRLSKSMSRGVSCYAD